MLVINWNLSSLLTHFTTNALCPSCRLLKPRPQFSSCAAFACTCPRTSWPAGVWETSRITSAHTCLIKAFCSTQPHREKPFPSLLPKPSEANWCTHLHPFPFKRFELVLGSLLFFCYLLVLPTLTWSWFSSHPSFFLTSQCSSSSLCHFWIGSPVFFILLPLHSLLLTHPFCLFEPARTLILSGWLFSWSRTVNSTGHWRNSLCCIKTGTNNTQVFTVVLRWTCFYILVVIRKDC